MKREKEDEEEDKKVATINNITHYIIAGETIERSHTACTS